MLAREIRRIVSDPQQWWHSVRFSRLGHEKIELGIRGLWIAVLPPGGEPMTCDCDALTVIAGTVAEQTVTDGGALASVLVPGRIRVHGEGHVHQIRAAGDGYSVSLHGSASRRTRES